MHSLSYFCVSTIIFHAADVDYTSMNGAQLSYGPTTTDPVCASITIDNDDLEERNENFNVIFSSETPSSLDFVTDMNIAEVIITDDNDGMSISS